MKGNSHNYNSTKATSKPQKFRWIPLHWLILIAMVLGIVLGLLISKCQINSKLSYCEQISEIKISYFSWMGVVFLRLLKLIVPPLIFCAVFGAIANLKVEELGRIGSTTLVVFLCGMLISAGIGLFYVNIIEPGAGLDVSALKTEDFLSEKEIEASKAIIWEKFIPRNIFESFANGETIHIILIAIFSAIASIFLGRKTSSFVKVIDAVFEITTKLTEWIMKLTPFGVFGLVVNAIGSSGIEPLYNLGKLLFTAILGISTVLFVITPFFLYVLAKVEPLKFFSSIKEAMLTSFGTASSVATIPTSLKCVEEKLKVPKEISRFVITTGATLNMNGVAVYEAVVTLFIAQAYATKTLGLGEQILIVVMVVVSAFGTPGIPHASLITTTIVLGAVGLPCELVGLVVGVDRIGDMFRTMANVTGDCASAVIVNKFISRSNSSVEEDSSLKAFEKESFIIKQKLEQETEE